MVRELAADAREAAPQAVQAELLRALAHPEVKALRAVQVDPVRVLSAARALAAKVEQAVKVPQAALEGEAPSK